MSRVGAHLPQSWRPRRPSLSWEADARPSWDLTFHEDVDRFFLGPAWCSRGAPVPCEAQVPWQVAGAPGEVGVLCTQPRGGSALVGCGAGPSLPPPGCWLCWVCPSKNPALLRHQMLHSKKSLKLEVLHLAVNLWHHDLWN